MHRLPRMLLVCVSLLCVFACGFAGEVEQLVLGSRLPAGLVVIVRDPEPGLGEALVGSGRWIVHRLVPQEKVEELRRGALDAGLHGRLVFDSLPRDGRLPHPDRFADAVVASPDGDGIAEAELFRVLNVGGVAILRKAGKWQAAPRPAEAGIDERTHKWHGPSGHPLSLDRKAGPPTAIPSGWPAPPSPMARPLASTPPSAPASSPQWTTWTERSRCAPPAAACRAGAAISLSPSSPTS